MNAIPLYIESLKVRSGPGAAKAAGVLQNGQPSTNSNSVQTPDGKTIAFPNAAAAAAFRKAAGL